MSREQIQERMLDSPFNAFLDPEVVSADPGKSELIMRVKMRPELERFPGTGQWHGGPIAAAIDIVGHYAVAMLLAKPVPTINLRVDYLRPAKGTLNLVARVRRTGKTVGFVDVEVSNETGELSAIGRVNYSTGTA